MADAALFGAVLLLGEAVRTRRALRWEHRLLLAEQEKSERLLLNVLPASIAARLKDTDDVIADAFADVTVLFADIVDFTRRSQQIDPEQVVRVLNGLFSVFDQLAKQRGLEKIKTIGDAYMVVGVKGAQTRSCSVSVLMEETAEQVAHDALGLAAPCLRPSARRG